MYLNARDPAMFPKTKEYKIFDKDTEEEIIWVIWADDETGHLCRYVRDQNGRAIAMPNGEGFLEVEETRNIEFRKMIL